MSTLDTLLANITTFRRNYSGVFAWLTEATRVADEHDAALDSIEARVSAVESMQLSFAKTTVDSFAALTARVAALEAAAPAPSSPPYTTTNVTADRNLDANKTTIDELADVVGTVIGDLKAGGVFQ